AAAIGRIGLGVDAQAVAQCAARGRAVAGRASLTVAADAPATTAVRGVRLFVDALVVASVLSRRGATSSAHTLATIDAGASAVAAVGRIHVGVHAGVPAELAARAHAI